VRTFALVTVAWLGCANPGSSGGYRPEGPLGGLAPKGSDLAFSRTRFPLKVQYEEAVARFREGSRCGGPDSPESIIGRPDRRNQMHVARDRIVTYGFRFREATLLIRCRADVVEVARTMQ
jgi:hypothetical protein